VCCLFYFLLHGRFFTGKVKVGVVMQAKKIWSYLACFGKHAQLNVICLKLILTNYHCNNWHYLFYDSLCSDISIASWCCCCCSPIQAGDISIIQIAHFTRNSAGSISRSKTYLLNNIYKINMTELSKLNISF